MEFHTSYSWTMAKSEKFAVTDQPHVEGVTIHQYDFSKGGAGWAINLSPEHIPALLDAVKILLQYATVDQQNDANDQMNAVINSMMVTE